MIQNNNNNNDKNIKNIKNNNNKIKGLSISSLFPSMINSWNSGYQKKDHI